MAEPRKVKARLLDARYIKDAQSVLMILECEQGRFRSQVNRNTIASFGNRTESEIEKEMERYVEILKYAYVGKEKFINAIFDTELNEKMNDNDRISY
jgi:hypothetical protein